MSQSLQTHRNCNEPRIVEVDIIIPVHNASETIVETVESAMVQIIPSALSEKMEGTLISLFVCCYDDGSKDDSWKILQELECKYSKGIDTQKETKEFSKIRDTKNNCIDAKLLISKHADGVARGAGFARNRAIALRQTPKDENNCVCNDDDVFLCLLDSDDTMHPTRVAEQTYFMLTLPAEDRRKTLLGCMLERDPPDSTWHYTQWINGLTDKRLLLERYREITVVQPTWMMCRSWFEYLGGYVEAPHPDSTTLDGVIMKENAPAVDPSHSKIFTSTGNGKNIFRLIHPLFDNPQTLRLAEDLRLFHSHLYADGLLSLHRTKIPLVTYRHRAKQSQSFQTSRKLLLRLRVFAFETMILQSAWKDKDFVIWGAGRDGKEFVKALSEEARKRVFCFVDVDPKKLALGFYENRNLKLRIPIVHFSWLSSNPSIQKQLIDQWQTENSVPGFGRIDKTNKNKINVIHPKQKKRKIVCEENKSVTKLDSIKDKSKCDLSILPSLPVVVCVAMYRTNGILERNVQHIGRTEGQDLWHFS